MFSLSYGYEICNLPKTCFCIGVSQGVIHLFLFPLILYGITSCIRLLVRSVGRESDFDAGERGSDPAWDTVSPSSVGP